MKQQEGAGTFGAKVRARRRAIAVSQAVVASAVSITASAVSQIESGLIRGRRSTRDRIEAFLTEREKVAASAVALATWRKKSPRG